MPTIRVYHYGTLSPDADGVTRVDPSRFGAKRHTAAEVRAGGPPRGFFYTSPDAKEGIFDHAKRRYYADVDEKHLYDAVSDPERLLATHGAIGMMHEAQRRGYRGVRYPFDPLPPVVAMWHPQEVKEDMSYSPPKPPKSKLLFSRRAPAGGIVANNLFSKGGRFIANPLARVSGVMQRLRARVQLSRATAGNAELQAIAAEYRAKHGLTHSPPHLAAWSRPHAEHMAKVYDNLVSDPNDPHVRAAYAALNAEIKQQHDALIAHGYSAEYTHDDPYPHSAAMMEDLAKRRRIKVFKTPEGHHPLMTPEESDRFRFVHDVFGHAMHGHQFGPRGEDNAYRDHASMFSPLARHAMATETRGQNSWVNAGPHSHLPVTERPFAPQKVALWPEELQGEYHEMPVKLARERKVVKIAPEKATGKPEDAEIAALPEHAQHLLRTHLETGDRVPLHALADTLLEAGHHHIGEMLAAGLHHPRTRLETANGGLIGGRHGAVTLRDMGDGRIARCVYLSHPELGRHVRVIIPTTTTDSIKLVEAIGTPGSVRTAKARIKEGRLKAWEGDAPAQLARPHAIHPDAFPFEAADAGRFQPATHKKIDSAVEAAIADKPKLLPSVSEVKGLAHFGGAVRGGYADAGAMMHHMLPHPKDAMRWAAANAILSPEEGWVNHTEGAAHALALWHGAGRPTDAATLHHLLGGTGKPNVFWDGLPAPGLPAAYTAGRRLAPPKYGKDKAKKLVGLFSIPDDEFHFDPRLVASGSYKVPNFFAAHLDARGVPIDTHMAKLLRVSKKDIGKGTLLDAQKRLVGTPWVTHAYKALVSHAAREMGWEPRQVQEAAWTAVTAIMLAKKRGATGDFASIASKLHDRAIRAGWDMHTVFQSPTFVEALRALGVDDAKQAEAVAASRARLPVPGKTTPSSPLPAAVESAAERLPADKVRAAYPIDEALRLSRTEVHRNLDALIHLALLATLS